MAPHVFWMTSGLLLVIVIIVVQSVPIKQTNEIAQSSSTNHKQNDNQHLNSIDSVKTTLISTSTTTKVPASIATTSLSMAAKTQEDNNNKKKHYIANDELDEYVDNDSNENDQADVFQSPYFKLDNIDDNVDHKLHAKVQETPAQIHDNADKPIDTDNSKVFSDIKMTPSELVNAVRRRRDIKLNNELNSRRKRALLPFDFYDTDSYYDPYIDVIKESRPFYWYPSMHKRNIRQALAPFFYESSEYPASHSTSISDDELDAVPIFNNDVEDENDYDLDWYPVLLQPSNNPFDDLQLQEQYNRDDLPFDDEYDEDLNENNGDDTDDIDNTYDEVPHRLLYPRKRPYLIRYEPIETYF